PSVKFRGAHTCFILMAMFRLKRQAAGSELGGQRGTEATAVAGIESDRLDRLISHTHSRQRCDIVLAIVSAVDDFVVTLREALETRTCEDLQPRKQRDLVLNIAAAGKQLGCAVERKIVRRRRVEKVGD